MNKKAPETAIYVYGVVREGALGARALGLLPEGVPNATAARIVPVADGLAALVADVPLAEYSSAAIEARLQDLDHVSRAALGHERVIEAFMKEATIIPLKLFTLFSSEARVIEELAPRRRALATTLDRLEGREEWGVRVTFDERRAVEQRTRAQVEEAETPARTGTAFLARKRAQRDVKQASRTEAAENARQLYETLAGLADEATRRPTSSAVPGAPVILDAAFLVKTSARAALTARVEAFAKSLADSGQEVHLTGPWPPYSFVSRAS